MTLPEPELTPLAWVDMDALYDVVLDSSGSVRVATSIYEGVLSAVEAVRQMPESTPSVEGRTGITCDYRWAEHKGWLAFYHVKDDGGILVDRVLWGRSAWLRALGLSDGGM